MLDNPTHSVPAGRLQIVALTNFKIATLPNFVLGNPICVLPVNGSNRFWNAFSHIQFMYFIYKKVITINIVGLFNRYREIY